MLFVRFRPHNLGFRNSGHITTSPNLLRWFWFFSRQSLNAQRMLNGNDWNWKTGKSRRSRETKKHQEIRHLGNHLIIFQVATLKLMGIVNPLCDSEITHTLPEIPSSPQHKNVKVDMGAIPRKKRGVLSTPPEKPWNQLRWRHVNCFQPFHPGRWAMRVQRTLRKWSGPQPGYNRNP